MAAGRTAGGLPIRVNPELIAMNMFSDMLGHPRTRRLRRPLLRRAAVILAAAGVVAVALPPSQAHAAAPAAGGTYTLTAKVSGMCIDVPAASKNSGTLLQRSSAGSTIIVNNHSSAAGYGTSGSATVFVNGHDFAATNLTISNDYGEGSQACPRTSTPTGRFSTTSASSETRTRCWSITTARTL